MVHVFEACELQGVAQVCVGDADQHAIVSLEPNAHVAEVCFFSKQLHGCEWLSSFFA
jgi:hypothetical protein